MTDSEALFTELTDRFNRREWEAALNAAAKLLPLMPRHPGVYYIAGISNLELGRTPQAIECLRRASTLLPAHVDYAVQFARALTLANQNREAMAAAEHASSLASGDHLALDTLGVIYSQLGSYAAAAAAFREVVALAPEHAPYRYNLATALIAAGDIKAAETEINACLSLDPTYWRAHLTLAQLKRQTADANHLERLCALLSDVGHMPEDTEALTCLNLALAKEYEDLADYPKAMHHLVKGKSAAGAGRNYATRHDDAIFSALTASVDNPVAANGGYETREPIFVIGMPRSGTTLVERIISSHPDVQSAGELIHFAMSFRHFSQSRSGNLLDAEVITSAKHIDWTKLGEMYLSSTRPGTGQKLHFVDKLPHNFLYASFIAQALPYSKIICLRRNPMDTCLSNFRQLFAPNSPFFDYSFDLLDIGRYYILFDRLMAHWQRVLPGRILEIKYEELVDAQEICSKQLIEFCELPWDERCLRFEENPSPVSTASAVQVRAPVYRSALNRWKKYGAQLDALQQLLESAGIVTED